MTDIKTIPNDQSVDQFLSQVADENRKADCLTLKKMMEEITQQPARMWGNSIVGFGAYHFKYASGREGDWFLTGFSPRKQNLTIYVMDGFDKQKELMDRLGKHSTGKSCLYLKSLKEVDEKNLYQLIRESVEYMNNKYNQT